MMEENEILGKEGVTTIGNKQIFEAEVQYQRQIQEKYNAENLLKNNMYEEPEPMQEAATINKKSNIFQMIPNIFRRNKN